MDLREFVRDALVDISKGVIEANESLAPFRTDEHPSYVLKASGEQAERVVTFDVAVTSTAAEGGSGGAGLRIAGMVQVGAKGGSASSEEQVSRIRFAVVRNQEISRRVAKP